MKNEKWVDGEQRDQGTEGRRAERKHVRSCRRTLKPPCLEFLHFSFFIFHFSFLIRPHTPEQMQLIVRGHIAKPSGDGLPGGEDASRISDDELEIAQSALAGVGGGNRRPPKEN